MSVVKFENVTKLYKKNDGVFEALNNISFELHQDEVLGVVGASGAGKSTLLKCVTGQEKPDNGKVFLFGKDIQNLSYKQLAELRKETGTIFQQFNLFMQQTVWQNVTFPLKLAKQNKAQIKNRVSELLNYVGLTDKATAYPATLSGGQKQRVGIARALANNPKLLLLDEPTSALDGNTAYELLQLLIKIKEEKHVSMILITHEVKVARVLCDRVAVMADGKIEEISTADIVLSAPQSFAAKELLKYNIK